MFKISNIIFCMIAIWTAVLLFWTSQSVQNAERELKNLKQSSYNEAEMFRVLSSEWDYLNRPDRLEELAARYLNVETMGAHTDKMLTSAELVKNQDVVLHVQGVGVASVRPVSVKRKPQVPQEHAVEGIQSKIIKKVDQEKFTDLIVDITDEGQSRD